MHFVLLVSLLALISPGQFLAATSGMGTPHVTASTWTLEPVAYSGGGSPPRLAVDSMGIPHVFYCPPGDERYATRTLSGWTSEHVVSTAFGGGCGEFVMGRDDVPRITTGVVPIGSPCELYGVRVNETWAFECFPGGLMDGVDSRGRPHVATYWTISSNRY